MTLGRSRSIAFDVIAALFFAIALYVGAALLIATHAQTMPPTPDNMTSEIAKGPAPASTTTSRSRDAAQPA